MWWEMLIWGIIIGVAGAFAVRMLFRHFGKQTLPQRFEKIHQRISKLPTDSLPLWLEQSLGETGYSFSAWRRTGEQAHLDEAYLGARAVTAVLEEMLARRQK